MMLMTRPWVEARMETGPVHTRKVTMWKKVGQMARHVQTVVEGEHEEVAGQVGDVVPHDVLLQLAGGGDAGLVDYTAQPPDNLPRHQLHVSSRQADRGLGHHLGLSAAQP